MKKLKYFLLFLPFCLFLNAFLNAHTLSICAIFQNEAAILEEWIVFHKIQGVEHFFLYNNNSTDDFQKILEPYIQSNEVTLIDYDASYLRGEGNTWIRIQCGAYNHCLDNYGATSQWIAFLDIDEFLFCPNGEPLTQFLEKYTQFGGVAANWLMFGTSCIEDIPPNYLMIELLIRCANINSPHNRHVKSILQPKHVSYFQNPHFCEHLNGYKTVDANMEPIFGALSQNILLDKIRINHYWTRTEKLLREHKIPSRINRRTTETAEVLHAMADSFNVEVDTEILQFVPAMKALMNPVSVSVREN